MALKLYDHPLSPYGQKVKIALLEKGVEFDGMLPNAIGSGQVDATFAAAADAQGQATLTGTVAPGASLTAYAQATAALDLSVNFHSAETGTLL
jgi:hypothetical protein